MPLSAPANAGASRAERPVGGVVLRMGYEVDMAVLGRSTPQDRWIHFVGWAQQQTWPAEIPR